MDTLIIVSCIALGVIVVTNVSTTAINFFKIR